MASAAMDDRAQRELNQASQRWSDGRKTRRCSHLNGVVGPVYSAWYHVRMNLPRCRALVETLEGDPVPVLSIAGFQGPEIVTELTLRE